MVNKVILYILVLSCFSCKYKDVPPTPKQTEDKIMIFPEQTGFINDQENIFNARQKAELNKKLSEFYKEENKKIIIVSVEDFKGAKDFQEFAQQLGDHWNIGKDTNGNTVLLVFSKKKRKVTLTIAAGFNTGFGNKIKRNIVEGIIIPKFKEGKFYEGIMDGCSKLISIWQ